MKSSTPKAIAEARAVKWREWCVLKEVVKFRTKIIVEVAHFVVWFAYIQLCFLLAFLALGTLQIVQCKLQPLEKGWWKDADIKQSGPVSGIRKAAFFLFEASY